MLSKEEINYQISKKNFVSSLLAIVEPNIPYLQHEFFNQLSSIIEEFSQIYNYDPTLQKSTNEASNQIALDQQSKEQIQKVFVTVGKCIPDFVVLFRIFSKHISALTKVNIR